MSGPNARYALPRDEWPAAELPAQTVPAEPVPPAAASTLGPGGPQPTAPDRAIGLTLEVGAVGDAIAELRRTLNQIEQNFTEVDAALLDRQWGILNSGAIRLQALVGHMLKTIERRPAAPRKAA